jgi:hypothetical protein
MANGKKNIFISHVHSDDEAVFQLQDLLDKRGYQVRNSSIDSSNPNNAKDPDYIKTGILAPRIQWAGTMVTLISPETHTSDWVDWEIEYANKHDKRIVGVWLQGAKDADLPDGLELYADALVGWNTDQIIAAIEGGIGTFSDASGNQRPSRNIKRYKC